MKICPVGTELFRADRRTDLKKLIVAFRNFANAPKNTSPEEWQWDHWKSQINYKVSSIYRMIKV